MPSWHARIGLDDLAWLRLPTGARSWRRYPCCGRHEGQDHRATWRCRSWVAWGSPWPEGPDHTLPVPREPVPDDGGSAGLPALRLDGGDPDARASRGASTGRPGTET